MPSETRKAPGAIALGLRDDRRTPRPPKAKAIEYSLGRWAALMRYLDDGDLPIANNHTQNLIRPVALGRSNWLFSGSLRAGQRAAAIMSLIQYTSSMATIRIGTSRTSSSGFLTHPRAASRETAAGSPAVTVPGVSRGH